MKAIFISYNQAYNEEIVEILDARGQRDSPAGKTLRAGETLKVNPTTATMPGRQ